MNPSDTGSATRLEDEAFPGTIYAPPVVDPALLGSATVSPAGTFDAGSFHSFTVTYTTGRYGIDDSGSLRVCFRFAADQARPQFEDPKGVNYTTVTASNNAVLEVRYDPKGHTRPWDRTLYIKVVKGFMKEGDTITIVYGDTSHGGAGMRLQTFCEDTYEFRIFVDPIATCNYQVLPAQPTIRIGPGLPEVWQAVLPTFGRVGQPFRLCLKAEDKWGNPSDRAGWTVRLEASLPVTNLPETASVARGAFTAILDDLVCEQAGDLVIAAYDSDGNAVARSNPLRLVGEAATAHYWADMHGQSEETVGTNSARQYFAFARDKAFVDVSGHQGNDFQISKRFWNHLNELTEEFNDDGTFVTLPGYEWSGNTALGGDRNVYFTNEGPLIRRSSHALVEDLSDIDTDAATAEQLFKDLKAAGEDVVAFAHCGGRYADIKMAHDGDIERSIEIHSAWGTFEWLLQDAFEMGYRVGIVANSDGHKGRPGASYPGSSSFGAIGGLTCLKMPELCRKAVFDCLRKRHHYGTTGNRMFLDVVAEFDTPGTLYHDDPALGPAEGHESTRAVMGDIVHLPRGDVVLKVDLHGSAPIERLDLFNGLEHLETIRPYSPDDLGNRIRVIWEGAEYRGRFRQVIWDGSAEFSENSVLSATPINFFNLDKTLDRVGDNRLEWRALTTGNYGGFDAWVKDAYGGTLALDTRLVKAGVPLEEIGYDDEVFDVGALGRKVRIFRLPEENTHHTMMVERRIRVPDTGDNPIYVRITQEDGHQIWSSPIYLYR
jgi:hypothetical protein